MANSSQGFHEGIGSLQGSTVDRHRATSSIIEELEAIDWYDQRIDATTDESLRDVLRHNRDEEKEHAAMTLEWLRRRDPELEGFLRKYLFTEGSITELGEGVDRGVPMTDGPDTGDLGLGPLRDQKETL
jgi:ferritin-like protein